MLHARADYNRIQDPEGKIPEDEPVFLLRGQDKLAPSLLDQYAMLADMAGEHQIAELTRGQADRMRDWQRFRVAKLPDLPTEQG